jgi:asparagine synthase (glutamine-hydrolysing)
MCGFAGICFADSRAPTDPSLLEDMIESLGHRGPDGRGFHCEPGVVLGHSRLSVIDLAGGGQPIHNEDRTVWIVYNGEVFNYLELRDELVRCGHRFTTSTDTEVLVHLYEEHGDSFIERLNGQFAFALWDSRRRRLLLARDRAGILPLYWSRVPCSPGGGTAVVFGSEIKALFASGMVEAAPDPDGLDELWTFWAPVAPRTVFRGIEQVCPGEMVVVSDGMVERRVYWEWEFPADGEHRRCPAEQAQDELTEILGDATRIRLRADVPVGAYLSGGLDSSALVALLNRSIASTLHTFSISFEDPALDEAVHQRAVVRHLGTRHHQLTCTSAQIAASFPSVIRHTESPTLRSAPAPMKLLSQAVRQAGIKVVLTGEGADEVLGGYDIFKESKVRRFWAKAPRSRRRAGLLRRLYPYLDAASPAQQIQLREFFAKGLDTPDGPFFSHEPRWSTTERSKMFWRPEFAKRVSSGARERLQASLPGGFLNWNPFNRAEYLEAATLLPGYLLSSQGDRMLMSNSVEGRFPYLDHRLIGFANRLHPTLKMPVLREKHLLKESMRGLLPESVLRRHKQPYRAPDAVAFLSDDAPDYVREMTDTAKVEHYGYFDADKTTRFISKIRRRGTATVGENMAFMGILSTQLWHAEFIA